MLTLLHTPPAVHSNFEVHPFAAVTVPGEEVYTPSPSDLAFELGRTIGLDGHDRIYTVEIEGSRLWTRDQAVMFGCGIHAGKLEREAGALGRSLGETGSGISEPPTGMNAAERAAFRRGYAAGLDEFDRGEAMAEAWEEARAAEDLEWLMEGRDEAMEAMYRVSDDRLPMGMMD